MFYIILDNVKYLPSGKHSVDFAEGMKSLEKRQRAGWAGSIKGTINADVKAGTTVLAEDVLDYIRKAWWFDDACEKYLNAIQVNCAYEDVLDGRMWNTPSCSSADATITLDKVV